MQHQTKEIASTCSADAAFYRQFSVTGVKDQLTFIVRQTNQTLPTA